MADLPARTRPPAPGYDEILVTTPPGRALCSNAEHRRYGTAPGDVLRLERIARPAIGDDEVLIRVRAAGVDKGTAHLMAGQPYLMRIMGFGLRGPKAATPGWGVAGTVEAVGAKVTGLRPGDEVFGDITDGSRRYDVIIDIGGNRRLAHLRRALAPRGTLVITGGDDGGALFGGMGRNLHAQLLSPFVGQKLTASIARQRQADLVTLREMAGAGTVTPAIDRAYPLSQAPDAVRHLIDGRARGKVVISL